MLDGKKSARARLFENLRNDHLAESKSPEPSSIVRLEPLTPAQAEAFCDHAMRSLAPRS